MIVVHGSNPTGKEMTVNKNSLRKDFSWSMSELLKQLKKNTNAKYCIFLTKKY